MEIKAQGIKLTNKEKQKKERNERSKKKIRVCPYFTQREHFKLQRLANAVQMKETELLHLMYTSLIDNPNFVHWLQNQKVRISQNDPYYIQPVVIDGEIQYGQKQYFPDGK